MTETKPTFTKRTLGDFLLGAAVSGGLDILMPQDSDRTVSNTLRQALYPAIGLQFTAFDSTKERIVESTAMYVGSVIGQTAVALLKTYL